MMSILSAKKSENCCDVCIAWLAPLFLVRATATCASFFFFAPPPHRTAFSANIFAPPRHLITEPLHFNVTAQHFRGKNSRHQKIAPLSRLFKKIINYYFTQCINALRLLSHASCILSHDCCLLSHLNCCTCPAS